jgi:hypothetical protein
MPLARLRCEACSEPLGDPPFAALAVRCGTCGKGANVEVAADGAPPHLDAAFPVVALLRWLAAARVAMASGHPGVALGPCPKCRAPLVVSSRHPVSLPCPHCGVARSGPAAELLVDQWPEPWSRVEGPGTSLEYRVAVVDGAQNANDATAGCAHCGWPTPAADASPRCARCGAAAWAVRPSGQRVQLGVRVDGERDGRPMHALVPVVQGEAMLRTDAARTVSADTGRSILGLTGVGCAVAIAVGVLASFGIAIALFFALRKP